MRSSRPTRDPVSPAKNSFELTIDLLFFFVKDREMFFSPRRIPSWTISLLLGLTLLFTVSARAAQRFPKCCVWRVTNAKAPFYLVGSIHALNKKDYPLPAPYEIALRDSRRFLFEFDPNRHVEFEKKFEAAGKYPPGQDIRSKIDPGLLGWLRQNVTPVKPDNRRGRISRASSPISPGGLHNIWWDRRSTPKVRSPMVWTITLWIARQERKKKSPVWNRWRSTWL